jgi:hypothetical protein
LHTDLKFGKADGLNASLRNRGVNPYSGDIEDPLLRSLIQIKEKNEEDQQDIAVMQ